MTPTEIALSRPAMTDLHHPTLAVLEVALQAAIRALRLAHPELDADEPPPINDDSTTTTLVLADIVETSAIALLKALRHYRAVQEDDFEF